MAITQKSAAPLLSVSDPDWAEAARREAVLRPLSKASRLGRHVVEEAARSLELSPPRIYDLLRAFRADPVTASLLPRKPGQAKGTKRLGAAVEEQIEAAIAAVYLNRPRKIARFPSF